MEEEQGVGSGQEEPEDYNASLTAVKEENKGTLSGKASDSGAVLRKSQPGQQGVPGQRLP